MVEQRIVYKLIILVIGAVFSVGLFVSLSTPLLAGTHDTNGEALTAYDKGDYEIAFRIWQRLADGGDVRGLTGLGLLYDLGLGVEQNSKMAEEMYLIAANKGYADAQFNLGLMYRIGGGVPQDFEKALKWYQRAANQGDADAQYSLGLMYYGGQGVSQDYKQTVIWYRKAARQGYYKAQYKLGVMYETGQGVVQNDQRAVTWYREAANRGYLVAQLLLADRYEAGVGIPKNYVLAHMWLTVSFVYNDNTRRIEELEQLMTSAQIEESLSRASDWRPLKQ